MNSHTNRIVHPPGWEHAALVRSPKQAASILKATGSRDYVKILLLPTTRARFDSVADPSQPIDDMVVTLEWHGAECGRCRRPAGVWAPDGHHPRDIDFGSCPACDSIDGKPWHAIDDEVLAYVVAESAAMAKVDALWRYPQTPVVWPRVPRWRPGNARRTLTLALTEMAYRNMLPEPDELRVAWDLAVARGVVDGADLDGMTLVEIWARCMPLLWGGYVRS